MADTGDLKSPGRKAVRVRVPPRVPSFQPNVRRCALNDSMRMSITAGMNRSVKLLTGCLASLFVAGILFTVLAFFFLDGVINLLWYHSLGYLRFLILKETYRYLIFGGVTLLFFGVMFLNFWVASRYLGVTAEDDAEAVGRSARFIRAFRNGSLKVYTPLSLVLSILIAMPLYREWEKALLFFFAPAMNVRDTLFNLDISYYLFSLPIFTLLQGRLLITLVVMFLALGLLYIAEMRVLERQGMALYLGAKLHLSVAVMLIFLVMAWGYVLEAHMLQYSMNNEPLFYGPGFAEVRVTLPLIWASGVFLLLLAMSLIFFVHAHRGLPAVIVFAVLTLLSHGARNWNAITDAVNKYIVKPNELEFQFRYISSSIQATLDAYDLQNVERREYEMVRTDDRIPELGERTDLENIPLWDYELLGDVFQEVQGIRPYYRFSDVDTARYMIQDQLHQVFLAGREIHSEQLPAQAQNWVNRHLKYTHGFGAVMIPAAQRGEDRMRWFLRNMPLESGVGLRIDKPSIYYGTGTYPYAIAPNRSGEFHYPGIEEEVLTDYTGTGDLRFGGLFRRILFAVYFQDRNIFFTRQNRPDSRMMFRRNITERIQTLTPFLKLDRDPYLVVTDEQMFWIQDAYTTSNWYPNSDFHQDDPFNYIRNSVKIVVDAYNGNVDYYVFEEDCPIIRAYQRAYPGVFRSKTEMPPELMSQVRYPRDLFDIQMHMYALYHQQNPATFFKGEDRMAFAEIPHQDTLIRMTPYYLTLNLIDFEQPEFLLITPMLPINRDNLRALALVGSDGDNYGRIILYTFPRGSQFFGPSQINALIDQNTEIAQHITLWNQQGTEVRRGKMIVLPLGKHILYIQPLYLESAGRIRIPQLKRIIVSAEEFVVMDTTLERAIDRLRVLIDSERIEQAGAALPVPVED
jgi:uncharacterized membrane protein (UPF0182 family)